MGLFRSLIVASLGLAGVLVQAQTSASTNTDDLTNLRQRIAQQEEQIKKLQQSVEEQRNLLDRAVANINSRPAGVPASSGMAASSPDTVNVANSSISPPISMVPAVNRGWRGGLAGQNLQASQKASPLSIPIGESTFTPFGFIDFTFVGRSTNVGSGIGTNFGGIPYNNAAGAHLSEANFSAQNSRIGFRVDSKILGAKVLGYVEADFLGNQPTNVFVTSNADTFRMRNVFVDVQKGKVEILGGQDWSMFTPNRRLLSPIPSDIFFTQNMDTNYQVGLPWSRQTQFRFIYHPTKDWAAGVSLENPQQYIGGSGGLTGNPIALPAALASTLIPQFNNNGTAVTVGSSTVTGGQNYGVPNLHPDLIFKTAYDGHVGKNDKIFHVEAGALVRSFKDTIPVGTPISFQSHTSTSASGEVNANLEIVKNVKLIANTFFGQGGGRYIFGLAPDVIIRANGTIEPIHTYSTVDGIEANVGKNTLVDFYYGGVYIGRQTAVDLNGSLIGYGYRGSSNGDNRVINEYTFGLTQTIWKNPNWGALSVINQYSYLSRNPWYVATGAPKQAHTNMYFVDLRYTLP